MKPDYRPKSTKSYQKDLFRQLKTLKNKYWLPVESQLSPCHFTVLSSSPTACPTLHSFTIQCSNVPRKQCKNVPKEKCRSVPRQQCRNVPRQQCENVPRQVAREKCRNVPRKQCRNVPKEKWSSTTRQQCKYVPII